MPRFHRRLRVSLAGLLVGFVGSWCSAETYFVRTGGNDQADGKTAATAFKTIVHAAQVLNHGDDIVIGPGTYAGASLFADRFGTAEDRIEITGDESGKQTGDAAGPIVLDIPATADGAAIHLYRFAHATVTGLTFRGQGQGLFLEDTRDVIVQRCTFDGLSRGLVINGGRDTRVESSVFTRNVIGLFVKASDNTRIAHASIAGSSAVGAILLGSGKGQIVNSLLANNDVNFTADKISAATWSSDHNVLSGTTGPWGEAPAIQNPYEWFSASGQDRHSAYVIPALVNPDQYDLHIDASVTWPGGLPGNFVAAALDPKVELDRDGKPFRENAGATGAGAYDYPDPAIANGWQKLAATFKGDAPRQSAGLYTPDGKLLRMLVSDAAGVRDLYWDGLDDQGKPVAAGAYQVRSISHDVKLVDDGNVGDNGNPKGTYNPDNADRLITLPDGSFISVTVYDEAGMPLRRYSATGQPTFSSNLAEKDYWGIAKVDDLATSMIGGVGKGETAKLVRLVLPGSRAKFQNEAEFFPVTSAGEKVTTPAGLALSNNEAYVSLPELNIVRVIKLTDGSRRADLAVPSPADVAADEKGTVWVISGTDVCQLGADGQLAKKIPTGLESPQYLAAGAGKLAVVDRKASKIAIIDPASGQVTKTMGQDRSTPGQWVPVAPDVFRDPRGVAFFSDGRLLITDSTRIRSIWPETGKANFDLLSNFMDTIVVHPMIPQYTYCFPGIFEVDPKTGAWKWVVESPKIQSYTIDPKTNAKVPAALGSPQLTVMLDGKPFLVYFNRGGGGQLMMFDISEPLKPRLALDYAPVPPAPAVLSGWSYGTISFTKEGNILAAGSQSLSFTIVPFKGLDASGNPTFDFEHATKIGPEKDPEARTMIQVGGVSADRITNDVYYLAATEMYKKMVPGWGADGTGVGKSDAAGNPMWFARSSGGNYMSISTVNDGKQAWVLAGKSFGGQVDLFDTDGLRLTTGNWGYQTNYTIGFVDLRYGVQAYMRPDGKVGAYIEDDAIGRFARYRLDGAETVARQSTNVQWAGSGAPAGTPPMVEATAGKNLTQMLTVPKIAPLKVDGDWSQWEKAGVVPQVTALPTGASFKRNLPADLLETFRQGTLAGAIAHDGSNFYFYFVVADDTIHFDADTAGTLWAYDAIELWLEEEQFGLGMTKDGKPALHKFRFHNKAGEQWKANYSLPPENIWATKLASLADHPLGARLATITGADLKGKPGYAVMAKIPFDEVKLVGGIAGRQSATVNPTGASPGEIVRIGVVIGNITEWGREQDFKVNWPAGMMFSDPTRSYPFMLQK